jgi:hypothetical protein
MNPEQQHCFNLYAAMGEGRTANALHAQLQESEKYRHISIRQIQRWSAQFGWPDLAKQVNDKVVEKVTEQLQPVIESMVAEQIDALHRVQRRFIERLNIDPNDDNLTDAERARVIDPDFRDFQEAIKTERLITGDPTERREIVERKSVVADQLSQSDLVKLALNAARAQFGGYIPPSDVEDAVIVKPKELNGE